MGMDKDTGIEVNPGTGKDTGMLMSPDDEKSLTEMFLSPEKDEEETLAEKILNSDGPGADMLLMQFCHADLSRNQVSILVDRFGSVKKAYHADEKDILEISRLSDEAKQRFINVRNTVDAGEEWDIAKSRGITFVSLINEDFPGRLNNISDAPVGLFVLGRLPCSSTPALAIVGSRECSNYGKEVAIDIAKKLARAGIDIISGMAAGIDGFAHRGALNGGGDTFAVLGCGVDICYPRENTDIYARIQKQGGIISEYYPGTQPVSYNFPPRNRLISALSDGILVVEARQRSGSWITVDYGLEQGKDIYAIPGRINDRLSTGCNNLIRTGAKAVTKAEDIIEELAPKYLRGKRDAVKNESVVKLSGDELKIYEALEMTASGVEELCQRSGLTIDRAICALTMLEIKGRCIKLGNSGYARRSI